MTWKVIRLSGMPPMLEDRSDPNLRKFFASRAPPLPSSRPFRRQDKRMGFLDWNGKCAGSAVRIGETAMQNERQILGSNLPFGRIAVESNRDNNLNHLSRTCRRSAVDQRRLRVLCPVPMNVGGDELQPGHASIRIHVEDDSCWIIAKKILSVGLRK